jgi:hypothetical protein
MGDELGFGSNGESTEAGYDAGRQSATVYVEQVGETFEIETDDEICPVSPPTTKEAYEEASDILQE